MPGIFIFIGVLVVLGLVFWMDQRAGNERPKRSPRWRSFASYPDAIRTAAYRFINPPHIWQSYLGGEIEQIAKAKTHFENKRAEAMNLSNTELRDCVLAYIDYHVNTWLPKHERELLNQTTKRSLEAYRERQKDKDAKVSALLKEEGL